MLGQFGLLSIAAIVGRYAENFEDVLRRDEQLQLLRWKLILPLFLAGEQLGRIFGQLRIELLDFRLPGRLLTLLFLGELRENWTFVLLVSVFGVVEESKKTEVFLLRDRVVFVAVTLRTGDCRSHPHGHGRIHAINDRDIAELLVLCAAF